MYEIGKPRLDGKFNIWEKVQLDKFYWDWVIVSVCESSSEAAEFASNKNRRKQNKGHKDVAHRT